MPPLRIYLVSNLYPNEEQNDYYGVFVKNFIASLEQSDEITFAKLSLIKGRGKNALQKLVKYIRFYASVIVKGLFSRYDIMYVHNVSHTAIPVSVVRFFRKKQIVLNPHGEDIITISPVTAVLLKLASPLLRNSKIVVPSEFFKAQVIQRLQLQPGNMAVYPSGGVDTVKFSPQPRASSGCTCIGFVSRLDAKKGWKIYLRAIKALVDQGFQVKGLVAGKGDQVAEFEAMIKESGLENVVDYKGGLNQDALIALYRQMDIFVFPTELQESLGLVGLEAMSCGVPVIGSEIGGLQDYIHEGEDGYFIPPGDAGALAEKLKQFILLDPGKKKELSVNARRTALAFDAVKSRESLVKQLKIWYNTKEYESK